MQKPVREDIHLIARNSDWRQEDIHRTLQSDVYASGRDWRKLTEYLLLGAGASFLLSGVFFFFAYNWAALTAGVKIGIAVGCFLAAAVPAVIAPMPRLGRSVLHTAAAVLIGAILAVLGQVYQTGANAFDLFLVWSLLCIPWVVALPFAPLYLVAITLMNVTFITYTQQIGIELTFLVTGMLLFGFNLLCWLLLWSGFRSKPSFRWLLQLVAFWAVIVATVNVSAGAYDDYPRQLLFTALFAVLAYAGWVLLALRQRSIYYLALVGGGSLVTLTFLLLRWADFLNSFFLAGLLILLGVTALVHYLNRLNSSWNG
ncbi:putative membrane protein DUF2157 [Neolewinella xylanilytica]|uniref:Putative membrane protein DUF2157 n=1 Tax=Neolewinella xylanilytica TaxID=1514080 RepID=A0A2S6I3M6_9BACT|nr:DUF2157 domain-containing protein [Neolewinella xylanilytica]PPK85784.1 putative membrane protein DUF2157 [Neolewinella xylanilytica]